MLWPDEQLSGRGEVCSTQQPLLCFGCCAGVASRRVQQGRHSLSRSFFGACLLVVCSPAQPVRRLQAAQEEEAQDEGGSDLESESSSGDLPSLLLVSQPACLCAQSLHT